MPGDRATAGALDGYQLGAPATWGALPSDPVDGPDPGAARQAISALAASLTTDAEAASVCEQHLMLAQPAMVAEPHLAVCVWVPDPLVGLPSGVLVVDLLIDDAHGVALPENYLAALGRDVPMGRVERQDVQRVQVPAGEAVVVSALARDEAGALEESLTYVVFPDNSRDAIELNFATSDLHLAEAMVEDAQAIVDTLTVTATDA